MSRPESTVKTVSRDEAQQQLNELLSQVAGGKIRVAIEENGRPVAGLVSAQELEFLTECGPAWRERFLPLFRSWAAFKDESPEQIEREVERAVREVRRKYPLSPSD